MSLDSKVIWSEGMFLNPQHFQQQDRYFERFVNARCSGFGAYQWGLSELDIDRQLLALGKISISRAAGVFPDGTPFTVPDVDGAPAVLEVPENTLQSTVYLGIPLKRAGAMEIQTEEGGAKGLARYYSVGQEVRNIASESGSNHQLDVGKLRLTLLLDSDDRSAYSCIPIARINEARDDKSVILDEQFLPSCVDCKAAPKLLGFVAELAGLLHQRAEAIAGRLADVRRGGTAEIADYMLLQVLNRVEPLLKHLSDQPGLHPLDLYRLLLQISGELSTFVTKNKRAPEFDAYLHHDLSASFAPLMANMRQALSTVYEQTAISLPLVEKKYGVRISAIEDRSLLNSATYVLAVRADVSDELLRTRFAAQVKLGPVEQIRQLVNAALPGIALKVLPVAPRQIPYRSQTAYFELDKQSSFWSELQNSGGFALHVGGEFPGLELEFWAIRNQ
ncbi:type VI secretion system baseplate subunit TssK [Agaribacterium haliotis]|uniref:type VI secretion system baseplate subunit TssK n=1 Tax=Agaribacterium haliotis TaxID=2013869 RepID=UPI000BB57336|nr:type VI secretion system baseplate subunit TssK [Agaribacterium haliotis]